MTKRSAEMNEMEWLDLLAAVPTPGGVAHKHAKALKRRLADAEQVREALKLALACEPDDWRMWQPDARRALGLPAIEDCIPAGNITQTPFSLEKNLLEARVILQSWVNASGYLSAEDITSLKGASDHEQECFQAAKEWCQRMGPVTPEEAAKWHVFHGTKP